MKMSFLKYLGPENSLSGYQKSYKLVLYKFLFERMDDEGCSSIEEIARDFKAFYMNRIKHGKVPDLDVEPRIRNIQLSHLGEIAAVILQNPYAAIHEKGFLKLQNRFNAQGEEEKYLCWAPELVASWTIEDIENLKRIVDAKLTYYFSGIDNRIKSYNDVDIKEPLERILNKYMTAKRDPLTDHPLANAIRNELPEKLYEIGLYDREAYKITGSPGQGNWASVPWIAIMDREITTTTQSGIYIVYLYASDCETFYITLNQGCTELKNNLGVKKAVEKMQHISKKLSSQIDSRGFEIGDHADLKANSTSNLSYLYERGVIFYKAYHKNHLPENDEMLDDLSRMKAIYDDFKALLNIQERGERLDTDQSFASTDNLEEEVSPPMTAKEQVAHIHHYITSRGFTYDEGWIANFYLSLKSKPFVLLAGTSGTGKTKLVKLFSEAISAAYKLVPVRPDWSDASDLIGHLDLNGNFLEGKIIGFIKEATENPEKPYILCLDEMNLARVEHYFSDFLSIIETRYFVGDRIETDFLISESAYGKSDARELFGTLILPDNLYIVGTVNMDETTFPFSKKVLDRANTLEFSHVNLMPPNYSEREVLLPLEVSNDFLKTVYLQLSQCQNWTYVEAICSELQSINTILAKAEAHIGYRVRDEIVFYMLINRINDLIVEDEAMDYQILQKILPRIQGSSYALKNMLVALFQYCSNGRFDGDDYEAMQNALDQNLLKYPKSAEKIAFMVRRFEEDGFTAYWL